MTNELYKIKNLINDTIEHPVLQQYIEKPEVDEDKILVLISMFNANNTYKNVDQYIASIIIIQMALEIHDTITLNTLDRSSDVKTRQLTVLAGDFYSSQYYSLLAELQDFKMVGHISDAIQIQNERKTEILTNKFKNEMLFNLLEDIESTILTQIATVLECTQWIAPIKQYFLFKRLLSEKQKVLVGEPSDLLRPFFDNDDERQTFFVKASEDKLQTLASTFLGEQNAYPDVFSKLNLKTEQISDILEKTINDRTLKEGLS